MINLEFTKHPLAPADIPLLKEDVKIKNINFFSTDKISCRIQLDDDITMNRKSCGRGLHITKCTNKWQGDGFPYVANISYYYCNASVKLFQPYHDSKCGHGIHEDIFFCRLGLLPQEIRAFIASYLTESFILRLYSLCHCCADLMFVEKFVLGYYVSGQMYL